MTAVAVVLAAFAQYVGQDGIGDSLTSLREFLVKDGLGGDNGITDRTETTKPTEDQSENSRQSNAIDQDQTAAINEEIASGDDYEVASAAQSDTYRRTPRLVI